MNLIINNVEITTDEEGRFSINDLHKSSGGKVRHLPSKFMKLESVKEMVKVLMYQESTLSPIVKKQGRYKGGTWVCKELVYKYAMWINAEFEVKVIQTFDSIASSINPPATMQALNELTYKIEHDAEIASKCGQALNHYKKVKKENQDAWVRSAEEAQLNLGFK